MKKIVITYYCDDCKSQVEDKKRLYQVVYSLYSNNCGFIGKVEKEVCSKCFNYYSNLYKELEDITKG